MRFRKCINDGNNLLRKNLKIISKKSLKNPFKNLEN